MSRWVKFKRVLKWLGISALALFAIWTTLNIVSGIQLRHTMAELKQQGFRFSLEEIKPAPVPDDDNAAIPLRRAADMLGGCDKSGLSSKSLYPKLSQLYAFIYTNDAARLDISKWPAEVQSRLPSLVESKEMEELYGYVCKAAERKGASFDNIYSEGFNAQLPDLPNPGGFRRIVRCLIVKALIENQAGKIFQAYDTLLTAQKLVGHLDAEPNVLFFVVRMACDDVIMDAVQSIVNISGCSEEWAGRYIAEISKSLSRQTRNKVLDGEIYWEASVFERLLKCDTNVMKDYYQFTDYRLGMLFWVILRPLTKKDFQNYLLIMSEMKKCFVAPYYEVAADIEKIEEQIPKYYFFSRSLCFACESIIKLVVCHDAKVEVGRTGLALQIYKGRHGKYPDKLEQLVPDILPAIPVDPFTGKSLIYKQEGEGFLLYSVGFNRLDDHGDETLENPGQPHDIVWRCPR